MVCGIVGLDPTAESQSPIQLSFALAAFHTAFNLINTAILIWFIPQIEKLVCLLIVPRKEEKEDEFRLQFIKSGIMKTPEISILQAQKEIDVFGEQMQLTFGLVKDLSQAKEDDEFKKIFDRIEKNEDLSDRMEKEIGLYLGQVGDAHLSDESKEKLRAMLRQIGELESVGDSCYNLARILSRKRDHKVVFTEQQESNIINMYALVDAALTQMNVVLKGPREENNITKSEEIELQINGLRNQLKRENIVDLDNHTYDYENGTVYMDLISEFEKTGDYVINVVEARLGITHRGHPEQEILPEFAE
jgi:phosphate:Na+ symporter